MLYRPQPTYSVKIAIRSGLAFLSAAIATLSSGQADAAYLDRLDGRALDELGLRRDGSGRYRGFN